MEQIVVEGQMNDHNWLVRCEKMVYCMCVWQKRVIEMPKELQKESLCIHVVNQMSQ